MKQLKTSASFFTPQNIAWIILILFLGAISLSKAVLSISLIGLGLTCLWYLLEAKNFRYLKERSWVWLLIGFFFLAVLAGLWTEDKALWAKDLREKLPFLLIPLTLGILPPLSRKQKDLMFLTFIGAQTLVALITLFIFFQDYEQGIYDISKNKSIDIVGSISHIYFGLFLSFSTFLAFFLRFNRSQHWPLWQKHLVFVLGVVDGLCLHLLTSRTGLVSFYGTAVIALLWWIINRKKWLPGLLLLLGLVFLPVVAYFSLPSFKNRIDVTIWDLEESRNSERNLSELSVGTRFATWQTTWEIFVANPILGVGKGDLSAEMDAQYKRNGFAGRTTDLSHESHNQYLTIGASFGILGLILLVSLFFQYIFTIRKKEGQLFLLFVSLMLLGMFFESVIERQVGMSFFLLFSMILHPDMKETEVYREQES